MSSSVDQSNTPLSADNPEINNHWKKQQSNNASDISTPSMPPGMSAGGMADAHPGPTHPPPAHGQQQFRHQPPHGQQQFQHQPPHQPSWQGEIQGWPQPQPHYPPQYSNYGPPITSDAFRQPDAAALDQPDQQQQQQQQYKLYSVGNHQQLPAPHGFTQNQQYQQHQQLHQHQQHQQYQHEHPQSDTHSSSSSSHEQPRENGQNQQQQLLQHQQYNNYPLSQQHQQQFYQSQYAQYDQQQLHLAPSGLAHQHPPSQADYMLQPASPSLLYNLDTPSANVLPEQHQHVHANVSAGLNPLPHTASQVPVNTFPLELVASPSPAGQYMATSQQQQQPSTSIQEEESFQFGSFGSFAQESATPVMGSNEYVQAPQVIQAQAPVQLPPTINYAAAATAAVAGAPITNGGTQHMAPIDAQQQQLQYQAQQMHTQQLAQQQAWQQQQQQQQQQHQQQVQPQAQPQPHAAVSSAELQQVMSALSMSDGHDASVAQKQQQEAQVSLLGSLPKWNKDESLAGYFERARYNERPIEKKDLDFAAGIANEGNTCYVNSVFQTLLHTIQFHKMVKLVEELIHSRTDVLPRLQKDFPLLFAVYLSANKVHKNEGKLRNKNPGDAARISQLLQHIHANKRSSFYGQVYQQHDAQEFFHELLDTLDEEQRKAVAELGNKADSSDSKPKEPAAGEWVEVEKKKKKAAPVVHVGDADGDAHKSLINTIFGGQRCTRVDQVNEKPSETTQSFRCIHLDIQAKNVKSIMDAFEKDMETEYFSSAEEKGIKQKMVSLEVLPQVLVFHLKRFKYNMHTHSTEKVTKPVSFPEELVLPEQFMSSRLKRQHKKMGTKSDKAGRTYQLYSAVYHHGKHAESGHYTATIRDMVNTVSWFHYDDHNVSMAHCPVNNKDDAYLLFYAQVHASKKSLKALVKPAKKK